MSAAEKLSSPLEVVARFGPVLVVPAGSEALGFIVDSWCKSYERPALSVLGLPPPDNIPGGLRRLVCGSIHSRVKATLAHPDTRALVAVAEEAPSVILAHVVYTPGTPLALHYVYVGATVRRRGVARALLEAAGAAAGGTFTHYTPAGAALVRRFGLTYEPQQEA